MCSNEIDVAAPFATADRETKAGPPRVTVITIFLNAEKFLAEAMASVLAQTLTDWEYLLVDDGSTDGSTALAQEWVQRHPDRIRYVEHPNHENRGMSASRNRGLAMARGEFVAFLDADDVWLPGKLVEQLEIMARHPEAAMVYGRSEIWLSWSRVSTARERDYVLPLGVPGDTLVAPPALLLLMLENQVQTPTTCSALLRRGACEEVGGFQDAFRGLFEDQVFFAKICLHFPVFVADRIWARYRQHPESCCAVAEAAGAGPEARLPFLQWIQGYLDEHRLVDLRVRRALRRELWLAAHPTMKRWVARLQRRWRRWRCSAGLALSRGAT